MASKNLYDLTLNLSANSAELAKGIKEANSKMDGFQRNVSSQLKGIQTAFLTAAGVIGSVKVALETVKKGMNETGEGADNLEKFTVKLREGFDSLAKSIVQADFANMINNWKTATKAAGEYADSMDLVDDRLKDLSVKRAAVASDVSMLRAKQSEGTLTKEEAVQLKKSTQDLLKIEQDIYNAAISAQVKFIADKNNLNAELFTNLEDGINRRVEMNEQELKSLDNYVQNYKDYKDKLIKENTELVQAQTTGGGIMGNSGSTTMVTNMNAVNKALEEYLSHIPEVARLQIFQQQLAGSEDYAKLIEFYIKRNNLEGEYAGLLRRTNGAISKAPGTTNSPIARVEGISPVSISNITMPTLSTPVDKTKLAEPAKVFKESWVDALTVVNANLSAVNIAFTTLGDAISQASEDGKVTFSEAMNIISEAASSTIGILSALAAANMIAAEASKGLIGIVTAIAGLTMLASLWGKFVKPKEMADGGLAYGNSIVNVGEYANAANDPEVISPLSKLKGILGNSEMKGELTTRVSGSDLIFVLKNAQRTNLSFA